MFDTLDRDELREAMNSFQIAMFAIEINAQGSLICAGHNDLGTELTGLHYEDVVGKAFQDFMSTQDVERVSGNYWTCFETRKPVHTSVNVSFPSGPVMLESTVVPVFRPDGDVLRLIGNSVGIKVRQAVSYTHFLDELTRLSAESTSTLYDALRAIELRQDNGDITPDEQRFLTVFSQLSERALNHSLAIRDRLRDQGMAQDSEGHLLKPSALSDAIIDLTCKD